MVDELSHWDWDKGIITKDEVSVKQSEVKLDSPSLSVSTSDSKAGSLGQSPPDSPILKTKSLSEIYERCNYAVLEPSSYEEASQYEEWRIAMKEEIAMIEKNRTWSLVDRPESRNVIGVKWVFRTKINPDGSIHKHKERLVVKGYSQQAGVDYGDTFAPVARHETIRLILALAAQFKWEVFHLDVKSAFLNGELQEELFVEQPEGFKAVGMEEKVYKLHKALYGLKQAPRAWYSKVDSHLLQCGFTRSENEATLYVKKAKNGDLLIVSIYVDDMLVTGNDPRLISEFKKEMEDVFEMSDLGHMTYFLGMEISQSSYGIFISQKKYALDLLKKFNMESCKSVSTPLLQNEKLTKAEKSGEVDPSYYRSLVGSLLYLTASRPDLMFAASVLSRYMQTPSQVHLGTAKRVLRYIKGTYDLGIWYTSAENGKLQGFSDSDWAGCLDDMKSTTGYVFSMGSGVFSWVSRKQDVVAQSTAEAEYIATAAAANQAIWLRKVLADLSQIQHDATVIQVDNKSAIAMAKNPVQHGRTKHINVKFHAIRQAEKEGEVQLVHCNSDEQLADIMTKALAAGKFKALRSKLGVLKKNLKEEC